MKIKILIYGAVLQRHVDVSIWCEQLNATKPRMDPAHNVQT